MKKRLPLNSVGKLIRYGRLKKGMTEEELVDKINKPKITVKLLKQWEKGTEFPDLDSIYYLAEELDLNPNDMLNKRITIQDESIHKINMSNRKVGAYAFDTILSLTTVGIKLVVIFLVFLLLYYLISALQLILGDPGGMQEKAIVQYIENTVEEYTKN